VKAIVAAILAEPHKAVQLASVDQIELPYRTLTELVLSIVRPLGYNIRGTNDILARTGAQSPYGNVGTWYTGLSLYDPTVNAAGGDVTAQLALESPQSAVSTAAAMVNTEFGFTKVILSGATGVPLP